MRGCHSPSVLIEHGRFELMPGLIDLLDLILYVVEDDPAPASLGD